MKKYIDQMKVFEDFNFKLVIIDALLDKKPSFLKELEALTLKYVPKYEWYSGAGPIKEILQFCSELLIDQNDMDQITELCFDGGNKIYNYIRPDWDGEDDFFDIQSIKGFEHIKNLKSVVYISMVDREVLEAMKVLGVVIE